LIEEEVAELEAGGVPVYSLPDRTIRALRGLIEYGRIKEWRKAQGARRKVKKKGSRHEEEL